jgi:uncharacterized membrane protein YeaQ/YmgE (transglycosylase-associated protein family)
LRTKSRFTALDAWEPDLDVAEVSLRFSMKCAGENAQCAAGRRIYRVFFCRISAKCLPVSSGVRKIKRFLTGEASRSLFLQMKRCGRTFGGVMNIVIFILIGAIAGWLAGHIMRGAGFGIIGNIIVGIVGSFIGGFLLGSVLHLTKNEYVDGGITALIGAVILLFVIGLFKKRR